MLALIVAAPMLFATYLITPDADLIRAADAIAIVEIQSSHSYYTADGTIATDHAARVERALKPPLRDGMRIVVTQRGGIIGDTGYGVTSEPRFVAGERTLVALRQLDRDRYTTMSGELGKFSFVTDVQSRRLVVRGANDGEIFGWDLAGRVHIDHPRDADAFLRYISAIVAGGNPAVDYFVSDVTLLRDVRTNSHVGPYEYTLTGNARWEANAFGMKNINTETAEPDTIGRLTAAMGAWNAAPYATIHITYDGSDPAGKFGRLDHKNLIVFDRPDSGGLEGGIIAVASHRYEGTHTFNGVTYGSMTDCDIAIEEGLTANLLQAILGHELGHCLGIRHSNQPAPGQMTETSAALMNSWTDGNPILRDWDRDAASHLYGSGVTSCEAASIVTQPQDVTISEGSSATLSVSPNRSTVSFQWFLGTAGDMSDPIADGIASTLTVSPDVTTSYWVRISQPCDGTTADSQTATVSVVCAPPVITAQPRARAVAAGQSVTLMVTAAGSKPLAYQWYEGESGNTTNPVGTDSPSFTTAPVTASARFWVRISNACGSVDSTTVTVTVGGSRRRAVRHL